MKGISISIFPLLFISTLISADVNNAVDFSNMPDFEYPYDVERLFINTNISIKSMQNEQNPYKSINSFDNNWIGSLPLFQGVIIDLYDGFTKTQNYTLSVHSDDNLTEVNVIIGFYTDYKYNYKSKLYSFEEFGSGFAS